MLDILWNIHPYKLIHNVWDNFDANPGKNDSWKISLHVLCTSLLEATLLGFCLMFSCGNTSDILLPWTAGKKRRQSWRICGFDFSVITLIKAICQVVFFPHMVIIISSSTVEKDNFDYKQGSFAIISQVIYVIPRNMLL